LSEAAITHVFFELPGVLVDRSVFRRTYRANLARIMAERYTGNPPEWAAAYDHVLADWDSYYADLNLSSEDGIADLWEGLYRTTRALFRLTGVPEPTQPELTRLSRELPELASRGCDALFPEVPTLLGQLDQAGLVLGVISYSLTGVASALIAPVERYFKGAVWGSDRAEHFEKDVERYLAAALSAQVTPERCLMVDYQPLALLSAQQAGMQTFRVCPGDSPLRGLAARCLAQIS